jgi:hypothetical protein
MNVIPFPFKNGDVLSFPDTESEYVDVGIGVDMKVAETPYENLLIVRKCGRGFRFEMEYDRSEVFGNRRKFVSTKEYLEYFGNYSDLKFCSSEEDLRLSAEELESKYNI